MGKTSVKTACKPRFFRREGATSAWRNSWYELIWISIRFGGAMTSLIFPKLIRSAARDGIFTSGLWAGAGPDGYFCSKRHNAATPGRPRKLPANFDDTRIFRSVRELFQCDIRPGKAGRRETRRPMI